MKKLLGLFIGGTLFAALASASVVSCATVTNYDNGTDTQGSLSSIMAYFSSNPTVSACYNSDKLFSAFTYTGTLSGEGIQTVFEGSGGEYGVAIEANGTAWSSAAGFGTFSFDVTVCTSVSMGCAVTNPNNVIYAAQVAESAIIPPIGPAPIAMTNTVTPNVGSVVNLNTTNTSSTAEVNQEFLSQNAHSVAFSESISNFAAGGSLNSVDSEVFETTTPEPATMLLIGGGLLGLGLISKRRKKA